MTSNNIKDYYIAYKDYTHESVIQDAINYIEDYEEINSKILAYSINLSYLCRAIKKQSIKINKIITIITLPILIIMVLALAVMHFKYKANKTFISSYTAYWSSGYDASLSMRKPRVRIPYVLQLLIEMGQLAKLGLIP